MAEEKDVWVLEDLFKSRTEQEILDKALFLKKKIVEKKDLFKEDVAPEIVLDLIKLIDEMQVELSRLEGYYSLRSHIDVNDEEASAKLDYYNQLLADIANEIIFFELWFISLPHEKAQEIIESPIISDYKQHFKDLIKIKPHTQPEEIEKILNIKNITGKGAFSRVYDVFTASFRFDLLGEKNLTQEEVVSKYTDPDPKLREAAYSSVLSVFKENSQTLYELYKNVVLSWNNENLKIRNYTKSISPRNLGNDLPDNVVQTMMDTIKENIYLFQEYFKLKKEFLEKKGEPHNYSRFHIYAPYEKGFKNYSYTESKKICLETFKEFDEEFFVFAKKIFDEKHVHSHPQKGKRSGAFCAAPNNQTTPYIMLNHTNKVRDLFTMMHELGHGIHDLYSYNNPNLIHHPVLPLAETASILGETILSKKLLLTNDIEEKASLLMYLLDHYYATIVRQNYFVLFEEFAHKKILEGVTKKDLDDKYYSLLKEQFGEMDIPELFKHEWNYIPHIHHTPFYCYAYSWGNLLVLALYSEYEKNKEFKEKIKSLLRAGASKDTLEILKCAGIDPSKKEFWDQGFQIIKKELEEFKKIIKY